MRDERGETSAMKKETSVMRNLAIPLFFASVALNVCFIAGCRSLHDVVYGNKPCKFCEQVHVTSGNDGDKAGLVRIAELLEIKTTDKTSSDLLSDISYKLDRRTDVPLVFNAPAFEKMAKDLNPEEETAMRAYQRFISELQGKRVIVIEPEGE